MNYDKLCSDVLAIDDSIRFASVYTKKGDIVGGGMRKGAESFLIPEEVTLSLYYSKQTFDVRNSLAHLIGKEKYSLTEYAKVKTVSVPLHDNSLLLISLEPQSDHCGIIERVIKTVDDYQKK